MSAPAEASSSTASPATFAREAHIKYIINLDRMERDSFEYYVTEHLRMSGLYWGLTGLDLFLDRTEAQYMDKEKVIEFVLSCYHPNGGFSGNVDHDPHMLYTLSAVQILAVYRALDRIDRQKIADFIVNLQKSDGSFMGDEWGEVDTRFTYCALTCLRLLGYDLKTTLKNYELAIYFILKCYNFDGSFGAVPGAESHAGYVFTCLGALAAAGEVHRLASTEDTIAWWLCERQVKENGGLNGRPEKLADVCYSWWVLSSLAILDKLHWIDSKALVRFIMSCYDTEKGGISDRPDDMVDVYHTFFGICGLSLLKAEPRLKSIDPIFALPIDALRYCGLETPYTRRFEE